MRYRFSRFLLDTSSRRLTREAQDIPLQPREYDLLIALLQRPRAIWTRKDLLDRVWSERIVIDAALTQAISQLRRALEPEGRELIRTAARTGYAFEADVTEEHDSADLARLPLPESAPEPTGGVPEPLPAAPEPTPPQRPVEPPGPHWRIHPALAIGAIVGLLTLAVFGWFRRDGGSTDATSGMPPLVLATSAKESDGGADWRPKALRALMRTDLGALSSEEAASACAVLCLQLGFELAPESSADRVVLDWHLTQTGGKEQTWRDEAASGQLTELIDRVDAALASRVAGWRAGHWRQAKPMPEEALAAFGRATSALDTFRLDEARRDFEQVLALAPNFVHARQGLAETLLRQGETQLARAQAERALPLIDQSDRALRPVLLAQLYRIAGQNDRAADMLVAALAEDPSRIDLRIATVNALVTAQKIDAAASTLGKVTPEKLEPWWQVRWHLANFQVRLAAGDFRGARASGDRAREVARANHDALGVALAQARLATATLRIGEYADALTLTRDAIAFFAPRGPSQELFALRDQNLTLQYMTNGRLDPDEVQAFRKEAATVGNHRLEARGDVLLARQLGTEDRNLEALQALDAAAARFVNAPPDVNMERFILVNRVDVLLRLGRLRDTERTLDRLGEMAGHDSSDMILVDSLARSFIDAERGELKAATARLDDAIASPALHESADLAFLHCRRASLKLRMAQIADARVDLTSCIDGIGGDASPVHGQDGHEGMASALAWRARLAMADGKPADALNDFHAATAHAAALYGSSAATAYAEIAQLMSLHLPGDVAMKEVSELVARPELAGATLARGRVLLAVCTTAWRQRHLADPSCDEARGLIGDEFWQQREWLALLSDLAKGAAADSRHARWKAHADSDLPGIEAALDGRTTSR